MKNSVRFRDVNDPSKPSSSVIQRRVEKFKGENFYHSAKAADRLEVMKGRQALPMSVKERWDNPNRFGRSMSLDGLAESSD
jgi:hypothetical protein